MEYTVGVYYGMKFYEQNVLICETAAKNKFTLIKFLSFPISCLLVVNMGSSYDTYGLEHWSWTSEALFNTFVKLLMPVSGYILDSKSCSKKFLSQTFFNKSL